MLSCGVIYTYVALIVDLSGREGSPAHLGRSRVGPTAGLVVSVTCLKILRDREMSRQFQDTGAGASDRGSPPTSRS